MKKSKKMRMIPKKSNGPNIFERMQMRRAEKDAATSIIADSFCGVNWHEKLKIFPVFTVYKKPARFSRQICCALVRWDETDALDCHPRHAG